MTSRQALLISAPAEGADRIPGTHTCNETIKKFLMTPQGGAWKESEIRLLENPDLRAVAKAVKKLDADYTITCFAGAGFSDAQGRRFLILNDEDFFEDTELLNSSSRQLVLVDFFTGSTPADVFHFTDKMTGFEVARKMYDKWIDRCEPGQLILHSTSKTTHTAAPAKSGFFTRKLLQVAGTVPAIENKFNLKNIMVAGSEIQTLEAGEECDDDRPAISYEKGNTLLPFAMALPVLKSLPAPKNNTDIGGMALSMFLIGLFLAFGEG